MPFTSTAESLLKEPAMVYPISRTQPLAVRYHRCSFQSTLDRTHERLLTGGRSWWMMIEGPRQIIILIQFVSGRLWIGVDPGGVRSGGCLFRWFVAMLARECAGRRRRQDNMRASSDRSVQPYNSRSQ